MKAQRFIHIARVKKTQEHATKSNKSGGNGKRVRVRKAMDLYESRACTQDSNTTYLYPANIREVAMGQR